MSYEHELRRNDGVMRTSQLIKLGLSPHAIAAAVQAGSLIRPRRGWIALPQTDPLVIFAVQRGAVLTCLSQAKRLGLWVLEASTPHLAAPHRHSKPITTNCVIHWEKPLRPRVLGQVSDSIENVLGHVASCQPYESALTIWDSALNKRLIDKPLLEQLPLGKRARELLAASDPQAGSGLESLVRTRLRFLRIRIIAQAWIFGHLVDFLFGERLILQIDGAHHVGFQRSADIRHDAELRLRGFTVIRVGYDQVVNDWPGVQELVMRAVAQGLHLRGA